VAVEAHIVAANLREMCYVQRSIISEVQVMLRGVWLRQRRVKREDVAQMWKRLLAVLRTKFSPPDVYVILIPLIGSVFASVL
jgi:hypothetical protein